VVALIRAKYPTLKPAGIMQRLRATADDKGTKGWDSKYGYGVINPLAALTQEDVDLSSSPSGSPTETPTDGGTGRHYTTGQMLVGYVVYPAVCLLLVGGIVAAVLFVVRRRRRSAAGGAP
jgi:hypothetical protein